MATIGEFGGPLVFVMLHLQSNLCILICLKILSWCVCPLSYACISLGANHKTLYYRTQGTIVKKRGMEVEEEGRRDEGKEEEGKKEKREKFRNGEEGHFTIKEELQCLTVFRQNHFFFSLNILLGVEGAEKK